MTLTARLAAVATFGLLLAGCGSSQPLHYGYKPSVTPIVAMTDLEACYHENKLSGITEVKAAQLLVRAAKNQRGAQSATNQCMARKGYQIRQATPEDKKRLMALDVPNRKVAFGRLMSTGKF